MYLIGAVGEAQRATLGVEVRQRRIRTQARGTEHLHGAVDHPAEHTRHLRLDHGDLPARRPGAYFIQHPGGLRHQQTRLLDSQSRLADPVADIGILRQIAAECAALLAALQQQLQGLRDWQQLLLGVCRALAAAGVAGGRGH